MTSPRKPGFMLPVAVTLAVLLGLYVLGYGPAFALYAYGKLPESVFVRAYWWVEHGAEYLGFDFWLLRYGIFWFELLDGFV